MLSHIPSSESFPLLLHWAAFVKVTQDLRLLNSVTYQHYRILGILSFLDTTLLQFYSKHVGYSFSVPFD